MSYRTLLAAAFLLVSSVCVRGAIPPDGNKAGEALTASPRHGEWADIDLPDGKTKLHTWVSYPERKDKAPVVIVIHEIFGMTDWVRSVADALASEGFIAVAPDLLSGKGENGGNTDSFKSDAVRAAIQKLSKDEVTQRLDAAREYAIKLPAATEKTGTIGFCWGGGASFNYATRQPKLNGAIAYYGTAPTDKEALAKIACPVLGCYGGNDARVTATVEPTTAAMKEAEKSYSPHVYEGAGHGFLRQQSNPANQKAATEAWAESISFLKKNLEK